MAGSARETLILANSTATRWNEFDPEWYRQTYRAAGTDDDVLKDYLERGQPLGCSPNIFFDEVLGT